MPNGVMLPDLELDPGPAGELSDLYPTPGLRSSWSQAVDQRGQSLDSALASVDSVFVSHRNYALSLAAGLSTPALALDQADIAITQANLETQVQELQSIENQKGAVDAELTKVEQLDPTTHDLSPQTLTFPELDALDQTYAAARAEWEAAYPLWPLLPPG